MSQVYTIPVAFAVFAEDSDEAARVLVRALADAHLVGIDVVDPTVEIECWWTPNHPWADGSDSYGPTLVWSDEAPGWSVLDDEDEDGYEEPYPTLDVIGDREGI